MSFLFGSRKAPPTPKPPPEIDNEVVNKNRRNSLRQQGRRGRTQTSFFDSVVNSVVGKHTLG